MASAGWPSREGPGTNSSPSCDLPVTNREGTFVWKNKASLFPGPASSGCLCLTVPREWGKWEKENEHCYVNKEKWKSSRSSEMNMWGAEDGGRGGGAVTSGVSILPPALSHSSSEMNLGLCSHSRWQHRSIDSTSSFFKSSKEKTPNPLCENSSGAWFTLYHGMIPLKAGINLW